MKPILPISTTAVLSPICTMPVPSPGRNGLVCQWRRAADGRMTCSWRQVGFGWLRSSQCAAFALKGEIGREAVPASPRERRPGALGCWTSDRFRARMDLVMFPCGS